MKFFNGFLSIYENDEFPNPEPKQQYKSLVWYGKIFFQNQYNITKSW